jgi:hypothetical protein
VNRETRAHGLWAIALASTVLLLPGCLSPSSRGLAAVSPVPAVPVIEVKDSGQRPPLDLVSDEEVARARAALRDATAWGAEFYEPGMYAKAKDAFQAALAARQDDPARCRTLLADTIEASAAAREAALRVYREDVIARFETSRVRLLSVGADRSFPDEYARLLSGIGAATDLFAAGSWWDARVEAYHTLKGMSDLYETIRGLSGWLGDARVGVERALEMAREQDAPRWAPAEMGDAEQSYRDAGTRMQAGDLRGAVESMTAAGRVLQKLQALHEAMARRQPVAAVPAAVAKTASTAATPVPPTAAPAPVARVQGPGPAALPLSAEGALPGRLIRIANMSMGALGAPQKLYTDFSAAVGRFDLVAAEGLRDPGIMEKVLSGLDESWEAAVSTSGYFGFIYNDRIQMVKNLGAYPGKNEFVHAPFAAQFRLVGTRFAVNLVLCHVEAGRDHGPGGAETSRLADVYRYFEKLTGNRRITLLMVGGLDGVPGQAAEVGRGEMVSLRTGRAAQDPRAQGQQVFASDALRPRVKESGVGESTPRVAYIVLKTGT